MLAEEVASAEAHIAPYGETVKRYHVVQEGLRNRGLEIQRISLH